jgi:hypothetical protein
MEVSGQLHISAIFSTGKETTVPLDRRLSGPQSRVTRKTVKDPKLNRQMRDQKTGYMSNA